MCPVSHVRCHKWLECFPIACIRLKWPYCAIGKLHKLRSCQHRNYCIDVDYIYLWNMKVIQGSLWPIHKRTVHGNCPQWSSGGCSYQQGSVCAVHKGNARDNCTQGSTVGRCCPQGSMRTVDKQTAGGNCSQGSTGGRCCPQWSMRAVSFHKGIPIYKIKPTSKEETLFFQVLF